MSGLAGVAFQVAACGDSAVRVTAQGADREECWRAVHAIAAAIDTDADRFAITGVIPTYDAVLIEFDCAASTHDGIRQLIANLVRESVAPTPRPARHFDIPVVYGSEYGPDLDDVADQLGLSPAEVIHVHGSSPLTMRCFDLRAARRCSTVPPFRGRYPDVSSRARMYPPEPWQWPVDRLSFRHGPRPADGAS